MAVKEKTVNQNSNLQKYLQATHEVKPSLEDDAIFMIGDENDANIEEKREIFLKKKAEKKYIPFNSRVERNVKERPKTSLGPGSYNADHPKEEAENKQTGRK